MGLIAPAASLRRSLPRIRRVAARQAQPAALLLGAALIVWGVADFSTVLARVLAGVLLIVLIGIDFGRRA